MKPQMQKVNLKNFSKIIFCLFAVGFLANCQDDKMPIYSELGGLRVLAIVASSPDAYPGDTVTLTPYVSDILGSGMTFSAEACADPGVSFGVNPSCTDQADRVSLGAGAVTAPVVGDNYTGAMTPTISVNIPANFLTNRSPFEQFNGRVYLVVFTLTGASGNQVIAIKRIVVKASGATKNQNPVLSDILSQGVSLTTYPTGQVVALAPTFSTGAETYVVLNSDLTQTTKTEELLTTWFITDGKLKNQRTLSTDAVEYKASDALPGGRKSFIIAVSRDGRGGESVVQKSFP